MRLSITHARFSNLAPQSKTAGRPLAQWRGHRDLRALALLTTCLVATSSARGATPAEASAPDYPDYIEALEAAQQTAQHTGLLQNRTYKLRHEFDLGGGVLPHNPYYKGYAVSVGYTLHFSTIWAWQIASLTQSFNANTKLHDEVQRLAVASGNRRPVFQRIQRHAASLWIFKPVYGKQAFANGTVTHLELFAGAGPSASELSNASPAFVFGIDAMVGIRVWLNEIVSLRLQAVQIVHLIGTPISQALQLQAGVAFNLREGD